MIGGGTIPKPGEVTLSHNGVLFLDELPEFGKSTLEVLRQPLEDAEVCISRVHASLSFPAQLMLIASMNCVRAVFKAMLPMTAPASPSEIKRYTKKISGPLLDRIDIHIQVPRVEYKDLAEPVPAESSAVIRARVEAARGLQTERLAKYNIFSNAQMHHAQLKKRRSASSAAAQTLLKQVFEKLSLSARLYDRVNQSRPHHCRS